MNVNNNISYGQPNFKAMNLKCNNVGYKDLCRFSKVLNENQYLHDLCEWNHVNVFLSDKDNYATLKITKRSKNIIKRLLGIRDTVVDIMKRGYNNYNISGMQIDNVHKNSGMSQLLFELTKYKSV